MNRHFFIGLATLLLLVSVSRAEHVKQLEIGAAAQDFNLPGIDEKITPSMTTTSLRCWS